MSKIRCDICGKFIGFKDIGTSKIQYEFIPDTYHTIEQHIFTHTKCLKK